MKEKLLKIGIVVAVISQSSFGLISVSANDETVDVTAEDIGVTTQEINEYVEQNKELVEALEVADEEEYEEFIVEFMENSENVLLDNTLEYVEDSFDINEEVIYDETLIDEYEIADNILITFTPTEIFVDSFSESEEEIVTDLEELKEFEQASDEYVIENKFINFFKNTFSVPTVNANRSTRRKTATHSRTYYAQALGQKVITVGIGAEFTYNGTTVTARTTQNYTKTHWGSLGTWQLKSKSNGVQKPSKSRRIAYQDATFVQGVTVKGKGLVFQSRYLRANIESNQHGRITKTSVSR